MEEVIEQNVEIVNEVSPEQQMGVGTVGTDDELGKEIIETQLAHAEKELETLKQVKEGNEKLLARYSEQWEVEDKRWNIILNGIRKIEPMYEYENSDEYWDLQKKVFTYKYEEESHIAKAQIKRMKMDIESVQQKIDAQLKEIEEIKAAMTDVAEEEEEESAKEEPKQNIEDIKAQLEKDIKDAQSKMVSEEVQKKIEAERQKAKEEAMLQFEKDELAKKQAAEIDRLRKENEERERQAALQLEELKKKVDEMSASKQVIPQGNPFVNNQNSGFNINDLKPEDVDKIEQESLKRFIEEKRK